MKSKKIHLLYILVIAALVAVIASISNIKISLGNDKDVIYVKESESSKTYSNHHAKTLARMESMIGEKVVHADSSELLGFMTAYTEQGIYYVREDGKFYIEGDIYSLESKQNITDTHRATKVFWQNTPTVTIPALIKPQNSVQTPKKKVSLPPTDLSNSSASTLFEHEISSIKKYVPNKAPVSHKKPLRTINQTPNMPITDTSKLCYTDLFGFSQPKVGYDKGCNKLPKEEREKQTRLIMNKLPESFFITYKAKEEKSKIYVFTDYTCHYCNKLHKNIKLLNEKGISVYYLMYPRAIGNQTGNKEKAQLVVDNMTYAWCSDNQQESLDTLYRTKQLAPVQCKKNAKKLDNPIRQHYILADMFDIIATPLIINEQGKFTYGFKSVNKTLKALNLL